MLFSVWSLNLFVALLLLVITNSGNHAKAQSIAPNHLQSLFIREHEVPFTHTSKATKRSQEAWRLVNLILHMLIAENDKRTFKEPPKHLIYDVFKLWWTGRCAYILCEQQRYKLYPYILKAWWFNPFLIFEIVYDWSSHLYTQLKAAV